MNPCTVVDRTWMYQTSQDGTTKPRVRVRLEGRHITPETPVFDERFERQLPPEILAELEETPPRTFLREAPSAYRPAPTREPDVFLRPPPPVLQAPPPVLPSPPFVAPPPPPVIPPVYRPAQSAPRRGTGIWWLLLLISIAVLGSHLPKTASTRLFESTGSQIGPRRALPVVPRALPVTAPVSDSEIGQWHPIRFDDGTVVEARYGGRLSSTALLPAQGQLIGDERVINNTSWIWMQPAGSSLASWVDP